MCRTKGSLGKPKPNKHVIEGDIVIFCLHRKDSSIREEKFIIDLKDLDRVRMYRWCLQSGKYIYNPKVGLLHRFIISPKKEMQVDHKDGNGFNNRRSNLRECTRSQNMGNSKKPVTNTTGFKGVFNSGLSANPELSRKTEYYPFMSKIKFQNNMIFIGYYMTAEEAAQAYDKKARELFGEFARTNF